MSWSTPVTAEMSPRTWCNESWPQASGGMPGQPVGETIQSRHDGFLLGERSLEEQLAFQQEQWLASTRRAVEVNRWQDEPWAQG